MNVTYIVYRSGDELRTERLSPGEVAVLDALITGHPFAAACAVPGTAGADEAQRAAAGARVLLTACSRGIIAAAQLPA